MSQVARFNACIGDEIQKNLITTPLFDSVNYSNLFSHKSVFRKTSPGYHSVESRTYNEAFPILDLKSILLSSTNDWN